MAETEAPTFEKVWAMFQESAKKFDREMEESRKEDERRRKEREREMEESRKEDERRRKEREREIEEARKKHDEEMEQIRWERKETERIIGKLGNRFGEMVEHLIAPNIKEKFRAMNFNFDHVSRDHEITNNGRKLAEIDFLLENGDIAMAVEVKAKPVQKDVDDHIRRMEILRQRADAKNDRRKYQGAIAGAIVQNEVRDYAHKMGFYVIEQSGDTVRINIPEGFKAREW